MNREFFELCNQRTGNWLKIWHQHIYLCYRTGGSIKEVLPILLFLKVCTQHVKWTDVFFVGAIRVTRGWKLYQVFISATEMAIGRVPHTKTKEKLMNRLKKKKDMEERDFVPFFSLKTNWWFKERSKALFAEEGSNWSTLCNPFYKAMFEFWRDFFVIVS